MPPNRGRLPEGDIRHAYQGRIQILSNQKLKYGGTYPYGVMPKGLNENSSMLVCQKNM